MNNKSNEKRNVLIAVAAVLFLIFAFLAYREQNNSDTQQTDLLLAEYLDSCNEEWFLTGKKEYIVEAMMVSKETKFHNDLEDADYTVIDDGETVILKGTAGEMWTSRLSRIIETYTKQDGSKLSAGDFKNKDEFIRIKTIPSPDSNYAMFVPNKYSVTVETAWGDILHTNSENVPHGEGDYLICREGENGQPDLSDVWIVNGVIFKDTYFTEN